jgi:serine/threonine-protein kinase
LVQKTLAVSPANKLAHNTNQTDKDTNKYDPLPLLICLFLVGIVTVLVTNIYPTVKNFAAGLTGNNLKLGKTCSAVVVANSNVRSQPSSINSDNILQTIGEETAFAVTGKRTKHGWVEVKLKSGRTAWAHSDVIANNEQWVSCLRDREISIQTVDDSGLISTRPIPRLVSKPVAIIAPHPNAALPSPASPENAQAVERARQNLESGDLQGALAKLKAIPQKAVSDIATGVEMTNQWQQDWHKAEVAANDINRAIDRGQWDRVLAYRSHPEKLPNIKYWRQKLEPLFKRAEDNLAKELQAKKEDREAAGELSKQGSRGAGEQR